MAGIPPKWKCAVCGERVAVPIRCKYCGNIHCIDHHLPKDHNCPGLRDMEKVPERIIIYPSPDAVSLGQVDPPKVESTSPTRRIIIPILRVIIAIVLFGMMFGSLGLLISLPFSKAINGVIALTVFFLIMLALVIFLSFTEGESIRESVETGFSVVIVMALITGLVVGLYAGIGLLLSPPHDTTPAISAIPRTYSITYSIVLDNDNAEIDTLKVRMLQPYPCDSQKNIKIKDIQPTLYEIIMDSEHGNRIIYWKYRNIPENKSLIFNETFYCTISGISSHINRSSVGQYNTTDSEYILNTRSERFIGADNPQIKEVANEIVGNTTNPYDKSYLIYNWTLAHMRYVKSKDTHNALWALETRSGDCWEYSVLFSALCRAEGIPTRLVWGYLLEEENSFSYDFLLKTSDIRDVNIERYLYWKRKVGTLNPIGHAWTEIYIPNYGWIPVDASMGDYNKDYNDFYFGNLDNGRIIFQKGGNSSMLEISCIQRGYTGTITSFTGISINSYGEI